MTDSILTDDDRARWEQDGYLLLKGVLKPDEVEQYVNWIDDRYERFSIDSGADNDFFAVRNAMEEDQIFVDLIDHPITFPIALELLGPWIQLSMSWACVRPVRHEHDPGWLHVDGGQAMSTIRVADDSRPLQVKFHYFLNELDAPGCGNFTVVPGSHRTLFPPDGVSEGPYLDSAVQLQVEPGDVAVFPHQLWHGVVRNESNTPRKSIIYAYSHQCFRPYDYEKPSDGLLSRCTLRQRRLVGDIGSFEPGAWFYSPQDQEDVMAGR